MPNPTEKAREGEIVASLTKPNCLEEIIGDYRRPFSKLRGQIDGTEALRELTRVYLAAQIGFEDTDSLGLDKLLFRILVGIVNQYAGRDFLRTQGLVPPNAEYVSKRRVMEAIPARVKSNNIRLSRGGFEIADSDPSKPRRTFTLPGDIVLINDGLGGPQVVGRVNYRINLPLTDENPQVEGIKHTFTSTDGRRVVRAALGTVLETEPQTISLPNRNDEFPIRMVIGGEPTPERFEERIANIAAFGNPIIVGLPRVGRVAMMVLKRYLS